MLLLGRAGRRGVKSCGGVGDGPSAGTLATLVVFEPYVTCGIGSPAGVGGSGGEFCPMS